MSPSQPHQPAPSSEGLETVRVDRLGDEASMQLALAQAQEAAKHGEVPVGAAVYHRGVLIAKAHNAPIALCDPTAHAEVLALREAAKVLGNYRLQECSLYVTLEPCAMCAGAIFNARVREVIYAAKDLKSGAAGSVLDLFADPRVNHHTQIRGGILQEQSVSLLQEFFKSQRSASRQEAAASNTFLREDAIRKPASDLRGLGCAHAQSHFYALKSIQGMRLHYRQALSKDVPLGQTYLCLHGANTSASFFEPFLSAMLAPPSSSSTLTPSLQGVSRLLVPDFLGHGASDRFKKPQAYTFKLAMNCLLEWVEALDLKALTVITHDASLLWGLMLKALMPQRVLSLVVLNACWRSALEDTSALKGGTSVRLPALGRALSQEEPPALALYERIDLWLQKGLGVADLEHHFARLSPDLSQDELHDLSSGFERPFERGVFEAFVRLFPSIEVALADSALRVEDLHKHLDAAFLSKSRLLFTKPFPGSVQPLPGDLVGSLLSGMSVSEELSESAFLSPVSLKRLGQVLRDEPL